MVKVDQRARGLLGAVVLALIAGSVLLSFNTAQGHWPGMKLPDIADTSQLVDTGSFTSDPAVINFWASWCVACRTEHPVLEDLANDVNVFGVNHLDELEDASRWLAYYGDPFAMNVFDADGRLASQLDIEALPVTLVVGRGGEIHYRHLGPLDSTTVETIIRPLVEDLQRN
jgi:cytochrome c biogenesis protein CcmG/thiol:disulfide interchange protein DsbE